MAIRAHVALSYLLSVINATNLDLLLSQASADQAASLSAAFMALALISAPLPNQALSRR